MNTPRVLGIAPGTPAADRYLARNYGINPAGIRPCRNCEARTMSQIDGMCRPCFENRLSTPRYGAAPHRTAVPMVERPKAEPEKRNAAVAELVAWKRGMDLRAQFPDGTVGTIAAALDYHVEYVDGNALKGSTDTWRVTGRCLPDFGQIWVVNGLPFDERERVLAHEIAHCLNLDHSLEKWDAERVCDSFAYGMTGARKP